MPLIVTAEQILADIEASGGETDLEWENLPRPECGTHAGRGLHDRLNEPLCCACRDFFNNYRRERKAAREQVAA